MNTRIRILSIFLLVLLLSFSLISCIHEQTGTGAGSTQSGEAVTTPSIPSDTTTGEEEESTPSVSDTTGGDDTTSEPKPDIPLPETNPSEFPNPPDPDGTKRY